MKNLILSLIFLIGFGVSLSAQQLDHVQGQVLVQLQKDGNLKNVLQDLEYFNGIKTNIFNQKIIVKSLKMYALEYDFAGINENEILNAIARHSDVQAAQFNHFIDTRLEPNDPQFADQWQYVNTGQSGGTPGADIDMDLAWDITTGGVTANGDTIVVAALDDGIDLNHADFEDNRWRNYAEIPNNGIDDDNNGYVDDYEGWNSNEDNDNIAGGGHGTPVAGIMGAKGNNEIGVSGVSWNVKVMIIKNNFNTNEAAVLAAYGYALTQRQRYNESNGEEGAFVVSTNASWGIDQGQPANAPLWCGFYDTLGEQGILNCGATANANFNIDEVGDLPTACPSDFMISVTNMNDNDVKVNGAGYGIETIDLGAFGANTWTTAQGGGYAGFGGTSGATPHVTGAIGLLYSAPCSNIASLAMDDPMAAALAVRAYILDGVDPNESLDGITVTGGRLNVRNSLDLLMANCGPCPQPSALSASNVTDMQADMTWINNDSTLTNDLRWREVGAMDWIEVPNAVSPYQVTDLLACTEYEFQVVGYCAADTSDYSTLYTFGTDGCCDAPEEITFVEVTETGFSCTWGAILAAESYNVRYKASASATWIDLPSTTDVSISIADLSSCTSYEVQCATVCAEETTEYTNSYFITLGGCGACTDNTYCDQPSGNVSDEWIESVTIAGQVFATGQNGGAATFLGDPPVLDASQNVEMNLAMAYSGQTYPEYFTVWIDLNQNGDFTDADEKVFASTSAATAPIDASFSIPLTATNGVTRMRVRMIWNIAEVGPCNSGVNFYGETEDYCVEITNAGLAICPEVMNLDSTATTVNSIDMAWDAVENVENYNVKYSPTAGGTETELSTTDISLVIEELEFCTEYDISVQTVCTDGGTSEWVDKTISTSCLSANENLLTSTSKVSLFPNPFSRHLQLQLVLNQDVSEMTIEVLNAAGQLVYTQTELNLSTGENTLPLLFDGSIEGVYFVKISNDKEHIVRRVVCVK